MLNTSLRSVVSGPSKTSVFTRLLGRVGKGNSSFAGPYKIISVIQPSGLKFCFKISNLCVQTIWDGCLTQVYLKSVVSQNH